MGFIIIIFIIIAIILSINIKYVIYEKNIENKAPEYSLGDWYYSSLTYKEQLLYKEIVRAAEKINKNSRILPYAYTIEEFAKIKKAIYNDRANLFYLNINETELYGNKQKSQVKLVYYDTKSNIKNMIKKFNEAVNKIINNIGDKSEFENDFDIEVAIHDYLILHIKNAANSFYMIDNPFTNTVYGALVNNSALSGGYSMAFKLLMNKYDLVTYIINGEANGKPHTWNMVYINQAYFHVDVTLNDGDLAFAENLLFHSYFNLSSAAIMEDHVYEQADVPAAYTENNYYNIKNLYISDLEDLSLKINGIILKAGKESKNYIELYTNFGKDVYESESFSEVIIYAIKRVNENNLGFIFNEAFRIYRAAVNRNILTIQLYYKDISK